MEEKTVVAAFEVYRYDPGEERRAAIRSCTRSTSPRTPRY